MKSFRLHAALITLAIGALAIGAPADADLLSRMQSVYRQDSELNAPEVVQAEPDSMIFDQTQVPSGPVMKEGMVAGYPFTSGCCQTGSSCCADLWRGYRANSHGGCRMLSWFEHTAARCGQRRLSMPFWPPMKGCGSQGHGCGPACHSCAPKHAPMWGVGHGRRATCGRAKLGLFDWLPAWKRCDSLGTWKGGDSLGKGHYDHHAGCSCGGSHGGIQAIDGGETIIAPHSVPQPAPAPLFAPTNSARRQLLQQRLFWSNSEY